MRGVIYEENLIAALFGVVLLAILVNLIELACTAGLPAVYTQILSAQGLNTVQYFGYLLLYNLAYMFDDALMLTIAVITLSSQELQERQGRMLKLLSRSLIFSLGCLLIFFPELLR